MQEWVRVVRIVKVEFFGVAVVVGKLHLVKIMEGDYLVLVRSVPLSACRGKVLRLVGMVLVVVLVQEWCPFGRWFSRFGSNKGWWFLWWLRCISLGGHFVKNASSFICEPFSFTSCGLSLFAFS